MTTFNTEYRFRGLRRRSWAVPLANMELCPHILTTVRPLWYSEFDWVAELAPITTHPVLYPHKVFTQR